MQVSNDQLMATHEEFRKLAHEHTQYELRLDSLTQKRFLTDDEKLPDGRYCAAVPARTPSQSSRLRANVQFRAALTAGGIFYSASWRA
jgi:hypothetical protein